MTNLMNINEPCGQCGGLVKQSNRVKGHPSIGVVAIHNEDSECHAHLENTFEQEVREGIIESKSIGYTPTYFIQMVNEHGAVQTTKRLLASTNPGEGFYKLWELKRLDLTVECLAADTRWYGDRWLGLFTEEEVAIASPTNR